MRAFRGREADVEKGGIASHRRFGVVVVDTRGQREGIGTGAHVIARYSQ